MTFLRQFPLPALLAKRDPARYIAKMATAHEPRPVSDALIRKIGALPRERVAEVEDFVDFIGQRASDAALRSATRDASAPAFAKVWDNAEDDAYDAL